MIASEARRFADRFKHLAEKNQRNDRGRGVEIDLGHPPGHPQELRKENRDRAVEICGARSDGDERIHVRSEVTGGGPESSEEPPP